MRYEEAKSEEAGRDAGREATPLEVQDARACEGENIAYGTEGYPEEPPGAWAFWPTLDARRLAHCLVGDQTISASTWPQPGDDPQDLRGAWTEWLEREDYLARDRGREGYFDLFENTIHKTSEAGHPVYNPVIVDANASEPGFLFGARREEVRGREVSVSGPLIEDGYHRTGWVIAAGYYFLPALVGYSGPGQREQALRSGDPFAGKANDLNGTIFDHGN